MAVGANAWRHAVPHGPSTGADHLPEAADAQFPSTKGGAKVTGQFAELHFAECSFAECQFVECVLPTCLFADMSKRRTAKNRNAICRHAFLPTCKKSKCQFAAEMLICRNVWLPKRIFAEM